MDEFTLYIFLYIALLVLGIVLVAQKESQARKIIGIILLIILVGIPLIGLSICGIMLMSH